MLLDCPKCGTHLTSTKNHWTEDDLYTLKTAREADVPYRDIAKALGRTVAACKQRAYLLGRGERVPIVGMVAPMGEVPKLVTWAEEQALRSSDSPTHTQLVSKAKPEYPSPKTDQPPLKPPETASESISLCEPGIDHVGPCESVASAIFSADSEVELPGRCRFSKKAVQT